MVRIGFICEGGEGLANSCDDSDTEQNSNDANQEQNQLAKKEEENNEEEEPEQKAEECKLPYTIDEAKSNPCLQVLSKLQGRYGNFSVLLVPTDKMLVRDNE